MRDRPELGQLIHPALPIRRAQVVWAVREEMARTIDDVLARRTRALYLNARVALAMAPETAQLMAKELSRDETWQEQQIRDFEKIAAGFMP
jgi:glycerol-3-phosphate dehydrogenase